MEAALECLVGQLAGHRASEVRIINHGSKSRVLKDLPNRLAAYAKRLKREDIRVLVLIDRDTADCRHLKTTLDSMAHAAGLATKSAPDAKGLFRVVNRIVVEELEAWFFGDVAAICAAYPGVPVTLAQRKGYRAPDDIAGGTAEKLFAVLRDAGHYLASERMPKIDVARNIAAHMDPSRNISPSFRHFKEGLAALLV